MKYEILFLFLFLFLLNFMIGLSSDLDKIIAYDCNSFSRIGSVSCPSDDNETHYTVWMCI